MRIAVNLTYLVDGKQPDGVGQYALNLLKGLQAAGKLNKDIHLFVFDAFQAKAESMFPETTVLSIASMGDFNNLNKYMLFLKSTFIDRCVVPYYLVKDRYDLLFHPFNAANDFISSRIKTVITVHDLFFKNFPAELSRKYLPYVKYRYEGLMHKPYHIVVPSQYVKRDIQKFYPDVNPDKITVINNPVWVDTCATSKMEIPKPYILCVNSIRNHKNLITLLKAFREIEDITEYSLILTGSKGSLAVDPEEYASLYNKRVVFTGYVSDEKRNYLYQNADLFISTSIHEGFGMTPVEAALFEIPVLTSRETSIPEITRGLVNYYEPADNYLVLAERIMDLLNNKPSPDELSHISNKLSREYDCKVIAEQYYDLFERLHGG